METFAQLIYVTTLSVSIYPIRCLVMMASIAMVQTLVAAVFVPSMPVILVLLNPTLPCQFAEVHAMKTPIVATCQREFSVKTMEYFVMESKDATD